MPRCEHCGAENLEGANFCVDCGQRLETEDLEEASLDQGTSLSAEDLASGDRLLTEAFALSDQGRLTEAVRLAQQALSHNPKSTTAHSLLGTIYERLGNRDAAIREYQAVLALSPGSTADRERLNELLGMPAAPQQTEAAPAPRVVSRRPDLIYIVGVAVASILLVIGIIVLINRPPREAGDVAAAPRLTTPRTSRSTASTRPKSAVSSLPVPGLPSASAGDSSSGSAPAMRLPSFPLGAGEEAFDEEAYYEEEAYLEDDREPLVLTYPGYTPPQEEPARFLPGGGRVLNKPPVIRMPVPRASRIIAAPRNTRDLSTARQFVASGRLQEAKQVYETTLAVEPEASPRVRQELATVYFQLNETGKSAEQFMRAYESYSQLLESGASGIEAEEARHGLAACEAALRALGL